MSFFISVHFRGLFLNILTYPNEMPPVEMPTRGETPFDSIFVVNGCKIIWCARVKGGIVAKLLKSGTVSLRDIRQRDKQGTISSHKNWLNKTVYQLIIFLKDLRQKITFETTKWTCLTFSEWKRGKERKVGGSSEKQRNTRWVYDASTTIRKSCSEWGQWLPYQGLTREKLQFQLPDQAK